MASRKHIIAGSILTVILIAAGFSFGLWINQKMPVFSPTSEAPAVKPNSTIYEASAPNKGRVNVIVTFPFTPTSSSAFILLPEDKAQNIQADDYVLLYNAKDELLPIVGRVQSIKKGEGDLEHNYALVITVEDSPDARLNEIVLGEIIVDVMEYAQRLPVSALVHHNDESAHVWEVIRGNHDNRTTKLRTLSKPPVIIGDFFILENGSYTSNIYILNPGEDLQEDQPVTIKETLYEAPEVPNPERIVADKVEWVFRLPEKPQPPGAGCGGTTTACGGSAATDYIAKIKAMAQQQAEKRKAAP